MVSLYVKILKKTITDIELDLFKYNLDISCCVPHTIFFNLNSEEKKILGKKEWSKLYSPDIERKDEHDSKDEYNIDPSQFDDEDEYVDALRKLWKRKYDYFNEFSSINPSNYIHEDAYGKAIDNKKNWMNKYDKDNAYKLDPSDYDCEEEYLDDLRCCWQHKYDPDTKTNVCVDDYNAEEDYKESLVNNWKETYDPQHRFNGFQFERFTTVDDYLIELNDRLDWIKKCDPDGIYSKIDPSKYDNMFQYQHILDLRKAWKKKYDTNNEHTNVDSCDYNSVEEYHRALMGQ